MYCGCCVGPDKIKNKVVVLNPKYCWLYPYPERKQLKQAVPNFDEHKTFYTKCDFKLEQCAQKQILEVEGRLKEYADIFENEIKLQKTYLSAMWVESTKWTILTRGGVCIHLYPEVVSSPKQEIVKCSYEKSYKKLCASLSSLSLKLALIRNAIDSLNHICAQLDMSLESPFIVGSITMKPLADIRTCITDLFSYHHNVFSKLTKWVQLLQINDPSAIEDYTALVDATKNFKKFLMTCNKDCCCMRSTNPECLTPHVLPDPCKTCMEQKIEKQMKNPAQVCVVNPVPKTL